MKDPRAERDLTVIAPIRDGHEAKLRAILDTIGDDVRNSEGLPFHELSTVHFMRWVVVPGFDRDGIAMAGPSLVLSTNFDPPRARHLHELVTRAADKLDEIYQHCEGWPPPEGRGPDAVLRYLEDHAADAECFYVGHPWRRRDQIVEEAALRRDLEAELDRLATTGRLVGWSSRQVYEHLRAFADDRRAASKVSYLPARRPWLWLRLALALLAWGLLALVLVIFCVVPLLIKEKLDARRGDADADAAHEARKQNYLQLADREDYLVQNQLTHLVEMKPGLVRHATLRMVLSLIGILARYYYNRGRLGDIPTIHFARWVLIDHGQRLLFFSNYDGSWESYLGDFVDKAAKPLSAIWSNTIGFPVTKALAWAGAKDEERFKTWARAQQIRTQVWYSAYPDLAVRNILDNTEVRRGLVARMNDDEVEEWLRKL